MIFDCLSLMLLYITVLGVFVELFYYYLLCDFVLTVYNKSIIHVSIRVYDVSVV
jgi:hypothetical protein